MLAAKGRLVWRQWPRTIITTRITKTTMTIIVAQELRFVLKSMCGLRRIKTRDCAPNVKAWAARGQRDRKSRNDPVPRVGSGALLGRFGEPREPSKGIRCAGNNRAKNDKIAVYSVQDKIWKQEPHPSARRNSPSDKP